MTNQGQAAARIASTDVLRGLVMLLTMLDHVRERFYKHRKKRSKPWLSYF